jgi:hypothetical protein
MITKKCKQLRRSSTDKETCLFIIYKRMLFSLTKGDSKICHKMDGPTGHCAKWSKSGTKRYCLISLTWSITGTE